MDQRAQHVRYVVAFPVNDVPSRLDIGFPLQSERGGIAVDVGLSRPSTVELLAIRKRKRYVSGQDAVGPGQRAVVFYRNRDDRHGFLSRAWPLNGEKI